MFALLKSDVVAKAEWLYGTAAPRALLQTLLTDGTGAMFLYRLMQWAAHQRLTPIEMLANRLNTMVNGCIIGRGAEFGAAFVLVHAGGIVINGAVTGGHHVVIEHQVTIGAERRLSPRLGNGVFVGAGAKILGNVYVGDGAKVGANAVVVKDVPPHTTAVGVPARILDRAVPSNGL